MNEFKIIYRFCDKRINTNYKNITKFDCLYNFIDTFGEGFTIVFDNTSEVVSNDFEKSGRFNVVKTNLGNSGSFSKCLDIVNTYDDNDIVYLVEDDYLHKPNSKDIIIEGLEIAEFVTVMDHPDKYVKDSPNPFVINGSETSRVYLTKSCHWKITNSTTMTFASKVKDIKKVKDIMLYYCKEEIPQDFKMWRKILNTGNVKLISSIPGHSIHCQEPWIDKLFDWNSLVK